jgi:hypothetical protein
MMFKIAHLSAEIHVLVPLIRAPSKYLLRKFKIIIQEKNIHLTMSLNFSLLTKNSLIRRHKHKVVVGREQVKYQVCLIPLLVKRYP